MHHPALLDPCVIARIAACPSLSVQDICSLNCTCEGLRDAIAQQRFTLRLSWPFSAKDAASIAALPLQWEQVVVECSDRHASCEPEYMTIWQKSLSALRAFGQPPQVGLRSVSIQVPWRWKVLSYLASGLPPTVVHLDLRCLGGMKSYSSGSSAKRARAVPPGLVLNQQPTGSGLSLLAKLPHLRALEVDVVQDSDIGELAALTGLTSLSLRLRDMPATSGCTGRDEGGLPHLRLHTHALAPLSVLSGLKSLSICVEGLGITLPNQDEQPFSPATHTRLHPPQQPRSTPASSMMCAPATAPASSTLCSSGAAAASGKSEGWLAGGGKAVDEDEVGSRGGGAKCEGAKSEGGKCEGAKSEGGREDEAGSRGVKSEGEKSEGAKSEGGKSEGGKSEGASAGVEACNTKGEGALSEAVSTGKEAPIGARVVARSESTNARQGEKQVQGLERSGSSKRGVSFAGGESVGARRSEDGAGAWKGRGAQLCTAHSEGASDGVSEGGSEKGGGVTQGCDGDEINVE